MQEHLLDNDPNANSKAETNELDSFNANTSDGDIDGDADGGKKHKPLSRFSISMLTINFIIGIGVLDLPYIFYQAGIVQCIVLVLLSALASHLAGHYVLEAQARGIMMEVLAEVVAFRIRIRVRIRIRIRKLVVLLTFFSSSSSCLV